MTGESKFRGVIGDYDTSSSLFLQLKPHHVSILTGRCPVSLGDTFKWPSELVFSEGGSNLVLHVGVLILPHLALISLEHAHRRYLHGEFVSACIKEVAYLWTVPVRLLDQQIS